MQTHASLLCGRIKESRTDLIYLIDYETGPRLQVSCAFVEHSTMVLLIHLSIGNQTLKFHPPTPNKEFTKNMQYYLDSLV